MLIKTICRVNKGEVEVLTTNRAFPPHHGIILIIISSPHQLKSDSWQLYDDDKLACAMINISLQAKIN